MQDTTTAILDAIPDNEIGQYLKNKGIEKADEKPRLLNAVATMRELGGISRMSLWRLVNDRKLRPTWIGNRQMFDCRDIDSFIKKNRKFRR